MSQDKQRLEKIRHSLSHLMSMAVLEIYPKAGLGVGPVIDNGFYQDYDLPESISEEIFSKLEKRMKEMIKQKIDFVQHNVDFDNALSEYKDDPYKSELIRDLKKAGEENVSFYRSDWFENLCKGPHVKNTLEINPEAFKLTQIAGAYWRGSEKNKMLTRIYGVAFATKEELEKYLWREEEAKKRDHRKLGQELDLFIFAEDVGPGLPLWTPRGTIIKDELEKWAKETEEQWGYVRVSTPHIARHTLYETSGHLPYYKDDMYRPMDIDGEDYYLKGMNCPHHHMIFKSSPKSYRDLPLRFAEYGMVYRYEQSGVLFGLMRVRAINQNDAHIYCALEQAEEEFLQVLKLHEYYYNKLGLTKNDYHIVIGLPDEAKRDKYHGDKALWDKAEKMMRGAIEKSEIKSVEDVGGAAFYGPKIDFVITSSIGREFAISTNQLDLYMPTRFNLEYTDRDGAKKLCAVIHRAPLGSHERFIGFLIEHFAGAFPVWLSPVQVCFAPVSTDKHLDGTKKLAQEFKDAGIRVEVDKADETVGNKVRKAIAQKVPYILVVGDKELSGEDLMIRVRGEEKQIKMGKDEFVSKVKEEIEKRK
ncbi:MAG: threonine--tRNA ligase [Patescibacteria group bacterium]